MAQADLHPLHLCCKQLTKAGGWNVMMAFNYFKQPVQFSCASSSIYQPCNGLYALVVEFYCSITQADAG